jgi:oligopeptide/dipeptide ABC transporter ATP-binding protein
VGALVSLFTVSGLHVHYRGGRGGVARAVDGVSLEWRHGEVLGVVGESGCGKSTLARAMLGLVPPAAGEVRLEGAPIEGRAALRALRRRVQMIFQDPYQTLNPRMRVRAIVREPLVVQGAQANEHAERVDRALADVGLPAARFADRYPHELSGGQRRRVAIAAALALDPDGLICDEPVSMLDVSVQAQVLKVLMDLRDSRSLALLFITHDLGLAWTLCDRIAVMYLGRIVEHGSAEQVIGGPRHPYTQALVAAVPSPGREPGAKLLPGEPPDAAHIPPGCRLHPRCPHRFEPCDREDPPLFEAGDGEHRAACLLLNTPSPSGSARA